ncbi:hypothetical protein Esti_002254 [Eimeria stiedai]
MRPSIELIKSPPYKTPSCGRLTVGHCSATVFIISLLLTAASAALPRSTGEAATTVLSSSYRTLLPSRKTAARSASGDIRSPPVISTQSNSSCYPSFQRRQLLSFLSSWTSPPQDFPEASFCGEWHVKGQLPEAAREEADAAADLVGKAGGPHAASAFLRVLEALRSGRSVCVVLSSDRLAAIRISSCRGLLPPFSFNGVWQVRGRPFLRPLLEIEFAFPPEDPVVILVINAPLSFLAAGVTTAVLPLRSHSALGTFSSPCPPVGWGA